MDHTTRILGRRDAEDAACFLQRTLSALGLARRVARAGQAVSAASLARKVNAERLANNPVALSAEDALAIYQDLVPQGGIA
jgi:hypothetical protein